MKLFKKLLPCLSGIVIYLAPVLVVAQESNYFRDLFRGSGGSGWFEIVPFSTNMSLLGIIGIILQIAFALAGLVATFYLILGGYNYITAGGNPEAIEGAKATITNAIIGMIVILISYLLVDFLLARLGATNIDLPNQ